MTTMSALEKLEEGRGDLVDLSEVMCPICLSIMIEPVKMPCDHVVCHTCFRENVNQASLCCPLCRARIGSWCRKATREGSLVHQGLWGLIRDRFREAVETKMLGMEEEPGMVEEMFPCVATHRFAEEGEVKKEFQEEIERRVREERQTREEEERLGAQLAEEMRKEEENRLEEVRRQEALDQQMAKKLWEETPPAKQNKPAVVTPARQKKSAALTPSHGKTSQSTPKTRTPAVVEISRFFKRDKGKGKGKGKRSDSELKDITNILPSESYIGSVDVPTRETRKEIEVNVEKTEEASPLTKLSLRLARDMMSYSALVRPRPVNLEEKMKEAELSVKETSSSESMAHIDANQNFNETLEENGNLFNDAIINSCEQNLDCEGTNLKEHQLKQEEDSKLALILQSLLEERLEETDMSDPEPSSGKSISCIGSNLNCDHSWEGNEILEGDPIEEVHCMDELTDGSTTRTTNESLPGSIYEENIKTGVKRKNDELQYLSARELFPSPKSIKLDDYPLELTEDNVVIVNVTEELRQSPSGTEENLGGVCPTSLKAENIDNLYCEENNLIELQMKQEEEDAELARRLQQELETEVQNEKSRQGNYLKQSVEHKYEKNKPLKEERKEVEFSEPGSSSGSIMTSINFNKNCDNISEEYDKLDSGQLEAEVQCNGVLTDGSICDSSYSTSSKKDEKSRSAKKSRGPEVKKIQQMSVRDLFSSPKYKKLSELNLGISRDTAVIGKATEIRSIPLKSEEHGIITSSTSKKSIEEKKCCKFDSEEVSLTELQLKQEEEDAKLARLLQSELETEAKTSKPSGFLKTPLKSKLMSCNKKHKQQPCKTCPGCQVPNCGRCTSCRDMPQFGGRGTARQRCVYRKCSQPVKSTCRLCKQT